jgi:hypothetical protein
MNQIMNSERLGLPERRLQGSEFILQLGAFGERIWRCGNLASEGERYAAFDGKCSAFR